MAPEIIVVNAKIPTGNPNRPWATAFAIRDGRLATLGSAAEIQKLACPSTRIFDAGGRVVSLPPGIAVGSSVSVTVLEGGDVVVDSGENPV